jgi:hypothetical protein
VRLGRSVHLCLGKTPGQDGLAALLLLVHLSSQRTVEAVHQDCSFCQRGSLALRFLLVVRNGRVRAQRGHARIFAEASPTAEE